MNKQQSSVQIVHPGSFEAENHWYPKALNATLHPMVNFFLNLSEIRIIERYCHQRGGLLLLHFPDEVVNGILLAVFIVIGKDENFHEVAIW